MNRQKRQKRRPLLRRILRGILWLILAYLALNIVAGYLPFARLPELDAETTAALEARAEQMQGDADTGDRAMLLEDSSEGLDERIRLIHRAQREIVIVTYECHDGESTRDILAAALERAAAGVRVRFLVDGIAGRLDHMDEDLFRAVAIHPNVEVRFYNLITQLTPWRHMGRMHDKYVIVDDAAYILGGRNMFDKFLGDYPSASRSVDREVLVYNGENRADSSLFQLREYFEGMWNHPYTTPFHAQRRIGKARRQAVYDGLSQRLEGLRARRPELFADFDYAAATVETRGVWLVSNPTTIYAKVPVVFGQLRALMERAGDNVVLHSPYAILNRAMRDALAGIAAKTPVTLMVNAVENGANLVASGDYLFHRGSVLSTGVRLLEYAGGDSYHGKAVAIDDNLSVIGSFNLDLRSAHVDTELMLVIRGRDFNARLRRNMEALHADCREITPDGAERLPDGLVIAPLPWWKRAGIACLGLLLQPFRNLL